MHQGVRGLDVMIELGQLVNLDMHVYGHESRTVHYQYPSS